MTSLFKNFHQDNLMRMVYAFSRFLDQWLVLVASHLCIG
jgi:hypothetical protein